MKAPSSLRVIYIMCFIFVILCTIPLFSDASGFFAAFTAICAVICLLTARIRSLPVRLLSALLPVVLLVLAMLFGFLGMSMLFFVPSAAVLVFFAVFMAVGRFETEYWKFRKTYIIMTAISVFISIIYFLVFLAVVKEARSVMNLPGVMGFTLAQALFGIFVLTEMRAGEPDSKWRARNAGRILGIFSAVAAALVFVFLILSFIFSFITPTLGPHAEKLKTERIRFHETRIGYSPQYVPGGQQVSDDETITEDQPMKEIGGKVDNSFHWEFVAIGILVAGAGAFFICRHLKKKKEEKENPVEQKTPGQQEQLDNIVKIRSIYRQYISFLRRNGVQIGKGSTSQDILGFSKDLASEEEEEPNPEELEKGTEAEEKLRDIYIRARYGNPASITADDALQAAALLGEITAPKE